MYFSIIIPVYNRPDEIQELLSSLASTTFQDKFEVIIIEDGSTAPCESVVAKYSDKLEISYCQKSNSGPGDSRNYGMSRAKGDYFIIFDSDCLIPPQYLTRIAARLKTDFVDCFGGPDKALASFSPIQKAINFAMTSFLTTGGIRGGSEATSKFQPRSFNMGLSKKAFEASGGFGNIHPGEDPDLSIRLWNAGFKTALFADAYVFHKRRIDWNKFYIQVNKFGKARPILNHWHPQYSKPVFLLPSLFICGFIVSLLAAIILGNTLLISVYGFYFVLVLLTATLQAKSITAGIFALMAVVIQFYGYGTGFIKATVLIQFMKRTPEQAFPELFFRKP